MKKYNITVNGKTYEVEVEEVGGTNTVSTAAPSISKSQPSPAPQPKPSPKKPKQEPKKEETKSAPKAVPQGAETVEAPMPGTLLDIKVSEGDTVEEGQVLAVLEAMKMENEIVSPRSGKVTAINATKGASVNAGDPLISLG